MFPPAPSSHASQEQPSGCCRSDAAGTADGQCGKSVTSTPNNDAPGELSIGHAQWERRMKCTDTCDGAMVADTAGADLSGHVRRHYGLKHAQGQARTTTAVTVQDPTRPSPQSDTRSAGSEHNPALPAPVQQLRRTHRDEHTVRGTSAIRHDSATRGRRGRCT